PGRRIGGDDVVLVAADQALAAIEDALQRRAGALLPVVAVVLPVGIALDVDRAARDAQLHAFLRDRHHNDVAVARRRRAALADVRAPASGEVGALLLFLLLEPAPAGDAGAGEDHRTDRGDGPAPRRRRIATDAPDVAGERQRCRTELAGRRARHNAERAQVGGEPVQVLAPVVGAQLSPGSLAELVERLGQVGGGRDRRHAVAHQRDDLRPGGEPGLELVARRVVVALDAALALAVARAEIVGRDEDEQDRRLLQRARDHVAPAAAGRQVVLVEEDLLLAEQRVEVARERSRLVGTVAGAVADEDACGHGAMLALEQVQTRMRKCGAICDSASTPTWYDEERRGWRTQGSARGRRRRRNRRRDRAPLRA